MAHVQQAPRARWAGPTRAGREDRRGAGLACARAGGAVPVDVSDAPILFHLFEDTKCNEDGCDGGYFDDWLSGLLHAVECTRTHPDFAACYVHASLEAEALDDGTPWSYLNMYVFKPEADINVFATFPDLEMSLGVGHMGQRHHPTVCREVACVASPEAAGSGSPGTAAPQSYSMLDVMAFAVYEEGSAGDETDWMRWSGVDRLVGLTGFRTASLYRREASITDDGASARFSHIVRAEFDRTIIQEEMGGDDALVALEVMRSGNASTTGGLFRCILPLREAGSGAPAGIQWAMVVKELTGIEAQPEQQTIIDASDLPPSIDVDGIDIEIQGE